MGIIKKIISSLYNVRIRFSEKTGVGIKILSNTKNTKPLQPFHLLSGVSIQGEIVQFGQYSGKKILLVNVASECGYTPQYKELQDLQQMNSTNLIILGFPSNDFAGQEPGEDNNIATFCERNFGISFPLFSKGPVTGEDKQPVYKWLTDSEKNGWNNQQPAWNFCKYLVDEQGILLDYFSSSVSPLSKKIRRAIEVN